MVDIVFRTLGPWGPGKGVNLQPSEVDYNFFNLGTAIIALQNNPAQPNGIASISVSGTQMTITLANGEIMGPFTLPMLTFRWRGAWQPNTSYAVLDVFTVVNTGIFMTQVAHTSGATFDAQLHVGADLALLQLFGSTDMMLRNLPDVAMTNPATGDILYWDQSAQLWFNFPMKDMAGQAHDNVDITGGIITGMPTPANATDVATKGYVDSAVATGGAPLIPTLTVLSNINIAAATAQPNLLTDLLDHSFSGIRGTILFRGASAWQALSPGAANTYLQTGGSGLDVSWGPAPGGITSLYAGVGLQVTPSPITTTGTVALATIPESTLLGNIVPATTTPAPLTLTQFLDHVLGNTRGMILTRNIAGWTALAPGTNGYYLKTQGSGSDVMWDAPAGSGTVTSITAGTGITTGGSPITATGVVALANVATNTVLANTSGSTAAPIPTTLTLWWDSVLGTTQGSVLYRSASAWVALAPGTNGQILTTAGAGANPSWQNAPITGSSTPNLRIVSNISGSSAVPTGNTLSNIFDAILSATRGSVIYRTSSGWVALAPGTSGQVLTTAGTGGDPSWAGVATNLDGLSDVAVTAPQTYDTLVYGVVSGQWTNQRRLYTISCYTPGVMSANQSLLYHKMSKAVTIPANFGGFLGHASQASGSVTATGSTVITLARATAAAPTTFTNVGSITFGAGTITGSWSTQAAITFAQGDILRLRGPATPDVSFADFHMSLIAFET